MKKRLLAMLMAGVMAAGCLTGCSSSSDITESNSNGSASGFESSNGSHKIAVVLKTLNSDYWNCMIAGIKQAEADFGCEVMLQGPPSETSYDEQLNEIETCLGLDDVEALVIAPLQPDAAANVVANAEIPILSVDTTFESDKLLSYVGVSNYDAAYAMGEYAAEQEGEGSQFVLLAGVQGDVTSGDRVDGYTAALEDNGCSVLEVQYTDAATDKAVTVMEGMMQKYSEGEIAGVLCHSDDVAVGAQNAIEQTGREEIAVYGFGGISGADAVKEGKLKASVNINPYEMGYNCVKYALDAVDGKELETFYPTEAEIIDESNIDDYLIQLKEWTS